MIDFLANLHEKAGRITMVMVGLILLGTARWTDIDPTSVTVIIGIYVGGASVVKTSQEITKKR